MAIAETSHDCRRDISVPRHIVADRKYERAILCLDDRDDLALGDDVVNAYEQSLYFSRCRRRNRNFHLHRFDECDLIAIADVSTGCNGKCAHAAGDFSDDLDIWHAISPEDRLTD
jgi:hypothetical protein